MRWVKPPPKRHPQGGDRRQRTAFLLFPKKDRQTEVYRWFEFAEWEEVYSYLGPDGEGDSYYGWVCDRWLNK